MVERATRNGKNMEAKLNKSFLTVGGVCGILWPISSEFLFYLLYPILAGNARIPPGSGFEAAVRGMAELGQNPSIILLEWGKVAAGLLVLPFLLAVYYFGSRKQFNGMIMVGIALGLMSMFLSLLTNTINPTLSHNLGQSYMDVKVEAERIVLLATIKGWFSWVRGINQTASLLYQACVGLVSFSLIRDKTWRFWGWLGLIGALIALPAKLPLGLEAPTNFFWTGIAYFIWPVGLGINLIKGRENSDLLEDETISERRSIDEIDKEVSI
jgi:hypothetical protein